MLFEQYQPNNTDTVALMVVNLAACDEQRKFVARLRADARDLHRLTMHKSAEMKRKIGI